MTLNLAWGEGTAERSEAKDLAELRAKIRCLSRNLQRPVIATLGPAHGCEVLIGLTGPNAVVLIQELRDPASTGWSREWMTSGHADIAGTTDYWLLDSHHTEWSNRHLIPFDEALDVLEEFLSTGVPPTTQWDENRF